MNYRPFSSVVTASLCILCMAASACAVTAANDDNKAPWDFSEPPRPFATSCFDRFPNEAADLTPDEAARWLASVDGRPVEITAPKSTHESGIMLKGMTLEMLIPQGGALIVLMLILLIVAVNRFKAQVL